MSPPGATAARLARLHPRPADPAWFHLALQVLTKLDRLSEVEVSFTRAAAPLALNGSPTADQARWLLTIAKRVEVEP